ncbi:hypothetical protein ACFQX7_02430 [Luedemannella flava]
MPRRQLVKRLRRFRVTKGAVIGGRRLAPFLVAAAVALASIVALVARPATSVSQRKAEYVIIAGAPGLRWDDLSPTGTPTLWRLAAQGSIGALAVRSARGVTCPADGWLTLGAGNPAIRTGVRAATRSRRRRRPGCRRRPRRPPLPRRTARSAATSATPRCSARTASAGWSRTSRRSSPTTSARPGVRGPAR